LIYFDGCATNGLSFSAFRANKPRIDYVYKAVVNEATCVVGGLWETTMAFAERNQLQDTLKPWMMDSSVTQQRDYGHKMYYNNFELTRIKAWQSDLYRDYYQALQDVIV
jgi:hypothetical protein